MIYLLFIYLIVNAFVSGYMFRDQFRFRKDFTVYGQMTLLFLFGSFFMVYAIIKNKKTK